MIPRKLVLRNFMCYREGVPPLEFDGISIACLSGENGAGKSALLDALTWALWGEARLRSDDQLIALGANEMEVELVFTLDHNDYRVLRKRSKSKRGQSWLDFQVRDNGSWKALSGATLRETQQLITSTLRMGYDTFVNSAFLRQGHADEFTRKEPGRRKQVLAEILGLDRYEQLETAAKERVKALDGQLKVLDGRINELSRHAEQQAVFEQLVAEADRRVAASTERVQLAEAALAEAVERLQALEQLRPLRDECHTRIDRLRRDRVLLEQDAAAHRAALEADEEVLAQREAIEAGLASLQEAQQRIEHFEELRGTYDALVDRRRVHADAVLDAERRLQADVRVAESELQRLREHAAQDAQLRTELAELDARLVAFATLDADLAAARHERSDLQERTRLVNELQLRRRDLQNQIDLQKKALTTNRDTLKRSIREATEQLKREPLLRRELAEVVVERTALEADQLRLEELRSLEREQAEQAGALRAACETIKHQGEEINKKLALLKHDLHACPLCGSELGHDGVAHIEAEYARERADLRARYSTSRKEADVIDAQLAQLRAEIAGLERRIAALPAVAARTAALERDLQALGDLRRRQEEEQRSLTDLERQLLRGDYERGVRSELAQVEAEIAGLGDPAALKREIDRVERRLVALEQQIGDQAAARARRAAIVQAIEAIEAEAPALQAAEMRVNELRTTIDMGDFAQAERTALIHLDQQLASLGYTPEQHQAAREEVRALTRWDAAGRRLALAVERAEQARQALAREQALLDRNAADLAEAEQQLATLEHDLRDLPSAARRRDTLRDTLAGERRALEVAQRDLGEKQALLNHARQAAADLATSEAQRKALIDRKGLFDELVVAFGKKGVQALLIETAIPEIEREANELLARMTDNQMHLTFETQRDTRKGDVSETLEIKIADSLGTRDYDAYSGGESFRVDFAIRVALAKLLARRAGARLETLVIDEGFGSQDARGRERLVEAITSVQSDFKQILVVTHIQELKDLFPLQIEITKTPQGSVWAIG